MDDKYVTVTSNTESYFFPNKCNNFKVKLAEPLDLKDGVWKVALTKITYPHTWWNLEQKDATVTIIHNNIDESKTKKLEENLNKVEEFFKVKPAKDVLTAIDVYFSYKYTKLDASKWPWSYAVLPLEGGFYQNAGEISEHIAKTWKLQNQVPSHTFDSLYESSTNKVRLFGADGVVFHNADKFVKALGLEDVKENPEKKTQLFWRVIDGRGKLDVIDTIYVYTSLVQHSNVGNAPVPLLTIVPVTGKNGDSVTYAPMLPEYRTLTHNYISDIELQLNTSTGALIDFSRGVVTVTLHFTR